MAKILIHGAKGRMGCAVADAVRADPACGVSATVDVGDDLEAALRACDAVIDFTHADATPDLAARCAAASKPLVIGTTGQDDAGRSSVAVASEKIPIVFAPNFSVGVNTLFWLTRKAAEILGPDFDLEIVEMHHRLKMDAPSGTARRLGEILAEARSLSYSADTRHGRHGMVGERKPTEIGMHSMRGGDVVGDHTVVFASPGERIELVHRASSRRTFAEGAVRAAKWVLGRPPGIYDMEDVLGLR